MKTIAKFFHTGIFVLLLTCSLYPQFTGQYLGQTLPDATPRRFSPASMCSNGSWWWHGSPSFSPDGKEMFFVKYISTKQTGNMEMYSMKMTNNTWSTPQRLTFASDSGDNAPVYSADGNKLFFTSFRSGNIRVYTTTRNGSGWTEPVMLNLDYNSLPGFFGWSLFITSDETIYFDLYSNEGGLDIYRARNVNGVYQKPEKLPSQINTSANEAAGIVDKNERYIIFMSNKPGGFGDNDLYVCFKKQDGTWGNAINLGNKINTNNEDSFPLISPDGKYLFFNSARAGQDYGYNPYWVSISEIEKQNPYTGVETDKSSIPAGYTLEQNFPNPFNPETTISFKIATMEHVRLEVFNICGDLVKTLINQSMIPGNHSVVWNGKDNSGKEAVSGIYFYKLTTPIIHSVKKAVLLR